MFGTNIFHSKAASLPPAPLHQVELLSIFSQLYSQLTHSTWAISKMDCPASTIRHRIRLWEGNKVESSPLLPSNSSSLSQFNTCDIPPKQRGCARRTQKGCEMFFDGASEAQWGHNKKMHRIMFQESKAHLFHQAMHLYHTPFPSSFSLTTGCSNNMTKYEAIIAGIK